MADNVESPPEPQPASAAESAAAAPAEPPLPPPQRGLRRSSSKAPLPPAPAAPHAEDGAVHHSVAAASAAVAVASAAPAPVLALAAHPPHGKSLFTRNNFALIALALQAALVALFATTTAFDAPHDADAGLLGVRYAMFQDVHVMVLIGFGLLYTLLRRYAWSGVSLNFLITVVSIQVAILSNGYFSLIFHGPKPGAVRAFVPLSIRSLIDADFSAATVLISFGALIGRVSPTQMLLMAVAETIFASANYAIGTALGVADAGGSIYIHVFGGAFGLAAALAIGDRAAARAHHGGEDKLGTSRPNGTFAMIGTLFLFVFWPSFNAAPLVGAEQQRAIINTVLSICASSLVSFALSRSIHGGKRFDAEHIQNSTLAGGVVMGAAASMITNAGGALAAGAVAGAVSTYGFSFLSARLKRMGVTDTCGILNLHLMPGLIGGFASAIAAPGSDVAAAAIAAGGGKVSIASFAGMQAVMTLIGLAFGLASGLVTGRALLFSVAEPMDEDFYEDAAHFNMPLEFEENPELKTEVGAELERRVIAAQRADLGRTVTQLVARMREAGLNIEHVELAATGAHGGPSSPGITHGSVSVSVLHGRAGTAEEPRSANERFLEGSVRGGRAYDPSTHGGAHSPRI